MTDQNECEHKNIETTGNIHFEDGEVTDDITECCRDCGMVFGKVDKEEIPF